MLKVFEAHRLDEGKKYKYSHCTLYDGTDAMMAQKLLKLGIPVTVATVENYRRLLLEQKGLETDNASTTAEVTEEVPPAQEEEGV